MPTIKNLEVLKLLLISDFFFKIKAKYVAFQNLKSYQQSLKS